MSLILNLNGRTLNNAAMKTTRLWIITVLTILLSSCTMLEINPEQISDQSRPVNLKITVAEFDGAPSTKVPKRNWAAGDKLLCWFDHTYTADEMAPDLVITYDGTNWSGELRSGVTPKATGGKVIAVYDGHSLSTNTGDGYVYQNIVGIKKRFRCLGSKISDSESRACLRFPLMYYTATALDYIYNDVTNTLVGTIDGWQCMSAFKVLVHDLPSEPYPDSYALSVTASGSAATTVAGFYLDCSNFSINPWLCTSAEGFSEVCTGAIPESDGLAFYFKSFNVTTDKTIMFSLRIMTGDGPVVKTYQVSGKEITSQDTYCQGVRVAYSKFHQ